MSAITHPPGVLTGRPMEMFGASPEIFLYAIPEQWGDHGDGLNSAIIEELTNALDHPIDPEMDKITHQLKYLEYVSDGDWVEIGVDDSWLHEFGELPSIATIATTPRVADFLGQFEEDFDYEESLRVLNFHSLLATPPENRPGWCGDSKSATLLKERYRWTAKIIHDFPSDRKGYALASTTYGKVYIPEKFRGYVPEVGLDLDLTVALQDVEPRKNGKASTFRFTAIYIH
jgi:hypothetical protein